MRKVPPLPSLLLSFLLLAGMILLIVFYGWVAFPAILVLALLPLLLLLYSTRYIQLCLRTGRLPQRPKGWEPLLSSLRAEEERTPLGSGWSFWLSYKRAPPHPIDLRSLRSIRMMIPSSPSSVRREGGRRERGKERRGKAHTPHLSPPTSEVVRVQCGATMGEVTLFLSKRGRALSDRSQFDDLSFGGGIRTGGHGFHSKAWMRDTILGMEGYNRRDGGSLPLMARRGRDGPLFRRMLDEEEWIIVSADVLTVRDDPVLVSQVVVLVPERTRTTSQGEREDHLPLQEETWKEWEEATYRYVFVDGKHIILKMATNVDEDERLVVSKMGEWTRRWNHARRLVGFPSEYKTCCRTSDVHTVISSLWPAETIFMRLMRYVNVELFVRLPVQRLPSLFLTLSSFHRRRGGRTEVRALSSGIVALDLAVRIPSLEEVRSSSSVSEWCSLLYETEGIREASIHTGKCEVDISPLLPSPYQTFFRDEA